MGQASTRSLTWPQEKQNRKRVKEDLVVMLQRSAPAAAGYDAQGAVGRQKAAGIAAGALSSSSSSSLHREGVRTRRDENGKNAVPKLRRAGWVGLLGLTFIAKMATIHNKI